MKPKTAIQKKVAQLSSTSALLPPGRKNGHMQTASSILPTEPRAGYLPVPTADTNGKVGTAVYATTLQVADVLTAVLN